MSVRRRLNAISQRRMNVPDIRSMESAVSNDFDELLQNLILGQFNSLVVRGLELNMSGAIGSSATGLQLIVANSAILHGKSNTSGTFYTIQNGAANQTINAAINTKVQGSFTPATLNYIGIELVRQVDDTTLGQVYLWNPSTNTEITKTLPLAEVLDYRIVVSSSSFASNILPIAIVETDLANNVVRVEDRRPMFFRLGTAGAATPNPFYNYPWSNDTEGRVENFYSSSSSTSPFKGGDKQIKNMKEFFDAVMTSIKEVKGTSYWYSDSSAGSITKLRQDLGHTVISGRGIIVHDKNIAGKINWSQDIFLNFIGGNLRYNLKANPTTSNILLSDNQVAFIKLVREVDIVPNLIFTNGANTVSSVGATIWTTNLVAGDFIKKTSDSEVLYYEIASVDSPSQVTLVQNFNGTSTGPSGDRAQYAFGSYETNATPSNDRHIYVTDRSQVPFDQDTYWLFFRSDNNGAIPRVYVRFTETELEQGESQDINDGVSLEILKYMGSPSETQENPDYTDLAPDAITGTSNYNSLNGQNLTERSSYLTSMIANKAQDKTVKYAENYNSVMNITNGTAQEISFIGIGTPSLGVVTPSVANFNNIITLSGTLSLEANEVAYFTLDRNNGFSIPNLSSLTITTLDSLPLAENVYVFAFRLSDEFVYLYNNRKLKLGGNPLNSGAGVIKATLHDPVSTTLPTGAVFVDGEAVQHDDRVLFSGTTLTPNRIYTAIASGGLVTSWRLEYDFGGFQDPSDGDFVVIQKGTLFADQLGKFDGTQWVFNDKVRYFNGTDYFEQSSLYSSVINNNQSVPADLTTFNFAGSEYAVIEYSINRGTARETGQLIIATDGVDVAMSQNAASLSLAGVTITADISGSLIRIRYVSDNSGSTGVFKFNIRRWSNSAGGPSGLPSYTGGASGSGNVTASGAPQNGQIAFFTGGNDITGNGLFKVNTGTQSVDLNGLEIQSLKVATLSDGQASPAVAFTYDISYSFAVIEFSLERNGARKMGRFMITHDGSTPEISEDFITKGDTEILFTADIVGSNVRVLYSSSSNGFNSTFKYSMRRWS